MDRRPTRHERRATLAGQTAARAAFFNAHPRTHLRHSSTMCYTVRQERPNPDMPACADLFVTRLDMKANQAALERLVTTRRHVSSAWRRRCWASVKARALNLHNRQGCRCRQAVQAKARQERGQMVSFRWTPFAFVSSASHFGLFRIHTAASSLSVPRYSSCLDQSRPPGPGEVKRVLRRIICPRRMAQSGTSPFSFCDRVPARLGWC